jgi:hypothetical protein
MVVNNGDIIRRVVERQVWPEPSVAQDDLRRQAVADVLQALPEKAAEGYPDEVRVSLADVESTVTRIELALDRENDQPQDSVRIPDHLARKLIARVT